MRLLPVIAFLAACGQAAPAPSTVSGPSAPSSEVAAATAPAAPMAMSEDHPCHHEEAAGQATAASLYDMPVEMTDQAGQAVGLDADRGHPTLVSMFYGSCSSACPMLISNLQGLEAKLSPDERANVRVLLVSLDPAHDDPRMLKALVDAHGLDGSRWTLATPSSDDGVRDVSAMLGVKYHRQPDGTINHSTVIALLDADGRIVERMEGPKASSASMEAALHRLAGAPANN